LDLCEVKVPSVTLADQKNFSNPESGLFAAGFAVSFDCKGSGVANPAIAVAVPFAPLETLKK
jgi:hypothetical protein